MHMGLLTIINVLLIALVVGLHFETLYQLAKGLPRLHHVQPRLKVLVVVFVILTAHTAEIWLFAIGMYCMLQIEGMGILTGNITGSGSLMDCVYLSFDAYTTVGATDVLLGGHLRYLVGLIALTGFVLITWSASFLYLEMQKYWPATKSHH